MREVMSLWGRLSERVDDELYAELFDESFDKSFTIRDAAVVAGCGRLAIPTIWIVVMVGRENHKCHANHPVASGRQRYYTWAELCVSSWVVSWLKG